MRKMFLWASAVLLFASCSGDDDPVYYPQPVTGTAVPSKITSDTGDPADHAEYTFTYDSEKRISKMVVTGASARTLMFTYTPDNQIATVAVQGSGQGLWTYSYDAFMRIESMTFNGQLIPIAFDQATETFSYGNSHFKFKDNGDLDWANTSTFEYDPAKKGAFGNINSSYHFMGMFTEPVFIQFGAKDAMKIWKINNNPACLFTNTYNDEGLPKEAVLSGLINTTLKFEYTHI